MKCSRTALKQNAASSMVCHNHPSGDPTPSPEDVAVTRQLVDAGKLLGAGTLRVVLDHLVIGHGRWKQFVRTNGWGLRDEMLPGVIEPATSMDVLPT